ncbi:MAG: MBL fold metallo-hydrolase, partial [Candidatus Hydrogenedentota bacterium]
ADIVLNTHYHEDHRVFNYCFGGARLLVHRLDAHGYGPIEDFMTAFSVVNSPDLMEVWRTFLVDNCKYRPYKVDMTFTDGFEMDLGHTIVQVVHTPGHSAGHCCFLFPREEVLYLGDIDLTSFGPWYASDNSDIDDFLSSIERIRRMRPRAVVTSHGDGLLTDHIDERLKRYADIIHRRDDLILNLLTQPRSLDEILTHEIIYRQDQKAPGAPLYWDDRRMIEMHLDRLERMGRLMHVDKSYSLA